MKHEPLSPWQVGFFTAWTSFTGLISLRALGKLHEMGAPVSKIIIEAAIVALAFGLVMYCLERLRQKEESQSDSGTAASQGNNVSDDKKNAQK